MSRPKRNFKPGYSYHITTRCNNREFRLIRFECRELLLYAIKKCQEKYAFKLYALCIMSNHVHYLDDAITQWHPAFLHLGATLDLCAAIYRKFCQQYQPKFKPPSKNHWGKKLLATLKAKSKARQKNSPGQLSLWEQWGKDAQVIQEVAEKFVLANCFDPEFAALQFHPPPN